jgi:hypothetical protein
MDWKAGFIFPARARNFSLLHSIETGVGAQPASYSIGTGAFYGDKAAKVVKLLSHLKLLAMSRTA